MTPIDPVFLLIPILQAIKPVSKQLEPYPSRLRLPLTSERRFCWDISALGRYIRRSRTKDRPGCQWDSFGRRISSYHPGRYAVPNEMRLHCRRSEEVMRLSKFAPYFGSLGDYPHAMNAQTSPRSSRYTVTLKIK